MGAYEAVEKLASDSFRADPSPTRAGAVFLRRSYTSEVSSSDFLGEIGLGQTNEFFHSLYVGLLGRDVGGIGRTGSFNGP